jgi:hypothetical protein
MVGAHVVQPAIGMMNERRCHAFPRPPRSDSRSISRTHALNVHGLPAGSHPTNL